jgi:uncharacterized damage-inducible protein DinB
MSEALIDELVEAWRTHDRINLFLLEHISDEGLACASGPRGGGRVWKQFAHMHTIRAYKLENWHKPLSIGLMKYSGDEAVPREELIAAFRQSGEAIERFFRLAAAGETKKRGFKKGLMTSLAYLVSHESHHRGSILLTLKLAGHPVPKADAWAIWDWDRM